MVPESNLATLYSLPQLAEITAESVAVWRKRVLLRKITFIKCGKNVRVPKTELERWLASRTVACKEAA